jgi:hypothetical protein
MLRFVVLLLLPMIAGCVSALPNEPRIEQPARSVKASVTLSLGAQVIQLNLGQPYVVNGTGFRMTITHDKRSMVSNPDGKAAKYRLFEVNGKQARSALHDLKGEPNRVADYVARAVVFADPIQSAGDVDRVLLEAFCDIAVRCEIAEEAAATVRFIPLP